MVEQKNQQPAKSEDSGSNTPAIKPPSYLMRWFLQYYRLVTVAACILILILGYFLLVSPKLSRAKTMEAARLTEEEERQQNLERKLQYLVDLSKKRAETRDQDVDKISAMLPSGPAVPELLASLEGIAKESKITIEGVELALIEETKVKKSKDKEAPPEDALPPGVRALEASVNVASAPYANLKSFLGNIEKSLRLMDVTALLYSPTAKSYTITIRTYYIP